MMDSRTMGLVLSSVRWLHRRRHIRLSRCQVAGCMHMMGSHIHSRLGIGRGLTGWLL